MKPHRSITPFIEHATASIVLALLMGAIGLAFASGWIPDSPQRQYFPGHQWVMAGLCWFMMLFLVTCACIGYRRGRKRHP